MKGRYLEVTFRKGKPLAAYLYLPREVGVKSARTVRGAPGILVDYSEAGSPIGVEITAPELVTLAAMIKGLEFGQFGRGWRQVKNQHNGWMKLTGSRDQLCPVRP